MREVLSNKITCIGVPTFERPRSLYRCLKTHLDNVSKYRGEIDVYVVDDSRSKDYEQANIEVVAAIEKEFNIPIVYCGRTRREELAKRISNNTDCPLHVSRFALLGHPTCTLSFGSARNALLLHAAGLMLLQVDDDTVCNLFKSPDFKPGASFYTNSDPNRYYLYTEELQPIAEANAIKENILALHESVLGTEVALANDSQRRSQINSAKIIATFLGSVGDSGMYGHAFRLFLKGKMYQALTSSEENFNVLMGTRTVLKMAPQTRISRGPFCMAMHMALDVRSIVPPFMPVLRNEDGFWGTLINTCFHDSFFSYLPYAIQHLPPENRSALRLEDVLQFRGLRVNDILSQLIYHIIASSVSAPDLKDVGFELLKLSKRSVHEFQKICMEVASRFQHQVATYAQSRLDENPMAPDYWATSVRTYIHTCRKFANTRALVVPIDLTGSTTERIILLQELIGLCGELLMHWPTMLAFCASQR